MESNWKLGVVAAGRDSSWAHLGGFVFKRNYIRAARLIHPFPIIGFMMRSLWQELSGSGYRLVFSASDLTTATNFLPVFHAGDTGTPFPGGFEVESDFPVTVL